MKNLPTWLKYDACPNCKVILPLQHDGYRKEFSEWAHYGCCYVCYAPITPGARAKDRNAWKKHPTYVAEVLE